MARYRESREVGDEPETATVKAVTTAGRAVLFAGTTVVIAPLGLMITGQRLTTDVAPAASSAPEVSRPGSPIRAATA